MNKKIVYLKLKPSYDPKDYQTKKPPKNFTLRSEFSASKSIKNLHKFVHPTNTGNHSVKPSKIL